MTLSSSNKTNSMNFMSATINNHSQTLSQSALKFEPQKLSREHNLTKKPKLQNAEGDSC